jgi:hypothetical protein
MALPAASWSFHHPRHFAGCEPSLVLPATAASCFQCQQPLVLPAHLALVTINIVNSQNKGGIAHRWRLTWIGLMRTRGELLVQKQRAGSHMRTVSCLLTTDILHSYASLPKCPGPFHPGCHGTGRGSLQIGVWTCEEGKRHPEKLWDIWNSWEESDSPLPTHYHPLDPVDTRGDLTGRQRGAEAGRGCLREGSVKLQRPRMT